MLQSRQTGRSLPVIQDAWAAVTGIDAEVSFVCDEENTRTLMDMAVVVDVDQQVSVKHLFLDPPMKDWNEVFEPDRYGICREKLDPESMNFHHGFPAALPV